MIYKDYEIFARVWESTSDLYNLTDDGELDSSEDIVIFNDDKSVVWYEVEMFDGEQFDTIEDAKKAISKHIKEVDSLYGK